MSDDAPPDDHAPSAADEVHALRDAGAWRVDPARFRHLETLARRLATQPAAVRDVLERKLRAAIDAYALHCAQVREQVAEDASRLARQQPELAPQLRRLQANGDPRAVRQLALRVRPQRAASPLAELNASIRERRALARSPGDTSGDELASARRFRRSWSISRTRTQVEQAAARKPANAGPLNSHVLVLRSLGLMQSLSPDYLRRFIEHVETLQWLETASHTPASPARGVGTGKPAKPGQRKRGKR